MHSADAAVTVEDVSFSWPDGTPVFTGLCATFTPGVTGLIGANGAGKTTLLRLIGAELTPHAGRIHAPERTGRVPQLVAEDAGATVSDLLGISRVRAALRAIEAGSLADSDYESVGEDWDIETRALALLGRFGFVATAQLLDAPATRLSGVRRARSRCWGPGWRPGTSPSSMSRPTTLTPQPAASSTTRSRTGRV
ncbi:MAG: ATP-binding cassette domain-containing protein [Propionibacteriaceae bacterium]|nr:ATP-binding cassette domain-containing protein [Propionibacteriaceae bacterium]